ncbi:MAG TPA: hypothetical protein VK203_02125 [Nostocaceae cyanobacterium]|nr:hypothetical protein [Nostocaceae cyanobacterium]
MVNNIKFILVGWFERSETRHFCSFVGLAYGQPLRVYVPQLNLL